jgi:hypothetical protein
MITWCVGHNKSWFRGQKHVPKFSHKVYRWEMRTTHHRASVRLWSSNILYPLDLPVENDGHSVRSVTQVGQNGYLFVQCTLHTSRIGVWSYLHLCEFFSNGMAKKKEKSSYGSGPSGTEPSLSTIRCRHGLSSTEPVWEWYGLHCIAVFKMEFKTSFSRAFNKSNQKSAWKK